MKVLTLIGGISKNSINKKLFEKIKPLAPTGLEFDSFDISKLPYFSQDLEDNPPQIVKDLRETVKKADGILFITPEYNRSIPGVLKNAIDWASRPYGRGDLNQKPAAILGASVGKLGTFGAQQHLKNVCAFLDMRLMNQPEFYLDASVSMDEKGILPQSAGFLENYLIRFQQWIVANQPIRSLDADN
jgi:chromate reductase